MAVYGQAIITNRGLTLYAKAQTGVTLQFTRMQIGSGQLAVGQDPKNFSALLNPISYFSINSNTRSGTTSQIRGVFENTGLSASTYTCEIGLFAQDPQDGEILYAYANAGAQGDTFPAISAGPFSRVFEINTTVGNAANVTVVVPSSVYIPTTEKGAASGVAPLDNSAKVPLANLPAASAATANTLALRDPNGRIKAAAPFANDDVARKAETDALSNAVAAAQGAANNASAAAAGVQSNLNNHAGVVASTVQYGHTILSTSTSSTAADRASTPSAVKAAYDLAAAALPAAYYTAADVLAKVKTVDGTGSGLDADVVRGRDLSGEVGTLSSLITSNKSNIVSAINELFTSASNGKSAIAAAITGKGVPASGSDTFTQLADKISTIVVGRPYASGSVNTTSAIFYYTNGMNTVSIYKATVGGLNFPAGIDLILIQNINSYTIWFDNRTFAFTQNPQPDCAIFGVTAVGAGYRLGHGGGEGYVNNNGFQLPVNAGIQVGWYVWGK
ncbi:tail fiber protein [Paenibacillus ginsengarvi]|uniref:Tail fiber protein n=1 Tax=Paenibacillus ginsengarvi TaxID=400777 RepID=A0A3B0BQ57_9BACL|nr:tail fiber protein [Paenibacillus ginsengarvi]RKN74992.1 hypothetical protein D7M11_25990 [Paenibacillus ginsengarvi]